LSAIGKYIIAFWAGLFFSAVSAMVQPPKAIRACLDPTTGIVTFYMSPTADACNSFVNYRLYGRDNAIGSFQLLYQGGTVGSTALSATLPNKKRWELFVSARFACNGTDTLNSDTVFVDDQPPALLLLDSVSVDLASQKVVAGWKKAPEADVMGYSVFKVDQGTGNNVLITDTSSTGIRFLASTFDSRNTGNKISIAVFDSCRNGGVICAPHSPVCASINPAENTQYRCTKKVLLRWTAYVGWPVDHYDIWYASSKDNLFVKAGSVSGDTLRYVHTLPELNYTYTYFIRAHKSSGVGITSSSNVVLFFAADFSKPVGLNIGHASVVSPGNIEISCLWTPPSPTGFKALLQYRENLGSSWITSNNNVPAGSGRFQIKNLETDKKQYVFRLLAQNPCGVGYDTSENHVSLLLTRNGNAAQWFDYQPYNPLNQVLEERIKADFTWNIRGGPFSPYWIPDTTKAYCYRVVAYKTDANNNRIDTAYSNEVCLRVYDTTLVPNAFSPEGTNKVFRIVNPNIEKGQATMYIYDRWGGKLWQGEALDGWNGEAQGQPVSQGFYVYKIEVYRPEKRELFQGTLMLLR
jgi:gliding motility-associated-like protein